MPLQGTFDVLPFADVLELLASREMTGRLHVRSRSTGANIYMEKGRLVGTEVGEQVITSADDAQSRLGDVSFELIEAELGSFEFTPDLTGMATPTINAEVGEILESARRQMEEWREIQTVVPSLDAHPTWATELPADEVTLSREQWRLLITLDGRRSIRAVARHLEVTDFRAARTLRSLIELGAVELDGTAASPPGAGREAVVFLDDTIDWAKESGNGAENGSSPVDDSPAMALGPTVDGPAPDPVAPTISTSPGDAHHDDSIWRGNVEDAKAKASDEPPPATPPPPVSPPAAAASPTPPTGSIPPAPIVAPMRTPLSGGTPATPAPAPSKVRRQGINWIGRKSRPPRSE
jgi:hypothetical protein